MNTLKVEWEYEESPDRDRILGSIFEILLAGCGEEEIDNERNRSVRNTDPTVKT